MPSPVNASGHAGLRAQGADDDVDRTVRLVNVQRPHRQGRSGEAALHMISADAARGYCQVERLARRGPAFAAEPEREHRARRPRQRTPAPPQGPIPPRMQRRPTRVRASPSAGSYCCSAPRRRHSRRVGQHRYPGGLARRIERHLHAAIARKQRPPRAR